MRPRTVSIAWALAVAATWAPAIAPAAPIAMLRTSDGDRIAAAIFPDARIASLIRAALEAGIEQELNRHPAEHADYASDPATRERVWRPVREEAEVILRRALPELRRELGRILDEGMTPAQTSQAARFFETPTGAKVITIVFSDVERDPVGDAEESRRRVREKLIASMTAEDTEALALLEKNDVGVALKAVTARCTAAIDAWVAKVKAENQYRLHGLYVRELERVRAEQRRSQ